MDDMKERENDPDGQLQLNFVDAWCAGHITGDPMEALNDHVDVWHKRVPAGASPREPLHQFLGFTREQYILWLECHMSLKELLDFIRHLRHLAKLADVKLSW